MAYDELTVKDTTSKIIEVMVRDSTTGMGKIDLAYTDMTGSYCREGGTRQAITVIAGTVEDAYSSGKWAQVDATNQKGLYQLHVPDAALATGVNAVTITLQATGMIDKVVRILLIDANLRDAVRLGLTALPNATPAGVGGLPTVDASNKIVGVQANGIDATAIADGAITNAKVADDVDVNTKTITAGAIDAAAIAPAAIDNATFAADVGSTAYATNILALAADKALGNYDPPTRTEATADKDAVIAALPAAAPTALAVRQEMDSNSTQLAAIVADTNELQTDLVNGGRLDLLLDGAATSTQATQILALLGNTIINIQSPVSATGNIIIYRGVDYLVANTPTNPLSVVTLPASVHGDLTTASVVVQTDVDTLTGSIINDNTETQAVQVELTHAQTLALDESTRPYEILVTLASELVPVPKGTGKLIVKSLLQEPSA